MIHKGNIEKVIQFNQKYITDIRSKINMLKSTGDPLIASKPLEYVKTYLNEHAYVLEYPIPNQEYGGLVFYYNKNFYIQINTGQPKIYENFMWAHEFYHFYFDKEMLRKKEGNQFVLIDSIFDEEERLPNLFAGELLMNDYILERKFNDLKKREDLRLEEKIIHLIPVFEVPYKAIVIKLAQEQFITIDEAKAIIDYNYRNRILDDVDQTIFAASNKIKIDHLNHLMTKAEGNLNPDDYQSIEDKFNQLYRSVLEWRNEMGGGENSEGNRKPEDPIH